MGKHRTRLGGQTTKLLNYLNWGGGVGHLLPGHLGTCEGVCGSLVNCSQKNMFIMGTRFMAL